MLGRYLSIREPQYSLSSDRTPPWIRSHAILFVPVIRSAITLVVLLVVALVFYKLLS